MDDEAWGAYAAGVPKFKYKELKVMGIQGTTPAPRSIDFQNPETVEHVIQELQENHERLCRRRGEHEDLYAIQTAEYNVFMMDVTQRIDILEAGLERYQKFTAKTVETSPGNP